MEICLGAAAYCYWSTRVWAILLDDDIRKPMKNMYAKVVIALATKDRIKAKSGDWPINCWFNVFCEIVLYTVQKRTVHFSVYLCDHIHDSIRMGCVIGWRHSLRKSKKSKNIEKIFFNKDHDGVFSHEKFLLAALLSILLISSLSSGGCGHVL